MLKTVFLAGVSVALLGCVAASTERGGPDESSLAHTLRGRVAGKPHNCLNLRVAPSSQIFAGAAVIFGAGSTLYLNRPSSGAESLSPWSVLLVKTPNGDICSGEAVRLIDSSSGAQTGVIFLGKFVPYRKVTTERAKPVPGGLGKYR